MAGPTNTEEAALLDGRLNAVTLWLGVSSTTPAETGSGVTEPSGGAYARVEVNGAGGAWSAAVAGAPTEKANAATLSFPQASAAWAGGVNLTHLVLYDAASGGTLRYFAAMTTPKPVLQGDTLSVAAGALKVQLGDPSDFA